MPTIESLLKDASELARRTNLQLIILFGALLLVWTVNLEDLYSKIRILESTITRNEVIFLNIDEKIWHIQAEIRETNEKIQLLNSELQRTPVNDLRYSEIVSEISKYRLRIISDEELIKRKNTLREGIPSSVNEVKNALEQKITFDVAQGVKLPFVFQFASIAWILLIIFALFRLKVQRDKFWRWVTRACELQRAAKPEQNELAGRLADMPFWLAPAPYVKNCRTSRSDLEDTLEWGGSRGLRWSYFLIAAVIAAFAVIRVSWIGLYVSGLDVRRFGAFEWPSFAILVAAAVALVTLALVCLPEKIDPVAEPISPNLLSRRWFVVGGILAGVLFVARAPTSSNYYFSRKATERDGFLEQFAWNRRRVRKLTKTTVVQLSDGFYANSRSQAIYYVRNGTAKGLVQPISEETFLRLDGAKGTQLARAIIRSRRRGAGLIEGAEDWAISMAVQNNVAGATDLLMNLVIAQVRSIQWRDRLRHLRNERVQLPRQLDLAAGLAIRFDAADELKRIVDDCEGIAKDFSRVAPMLKARIQRWTGNGEADLAWRRERWSDKKYGLRWNGKLY